MFQVNMPPNLHQVLLQDKSQDVVDLVQDIIQFQSDLEDSSQGSRNSSSTSGDHETALSQFMESLTRSRTSSFAGDSDLSDMENEIMQKSGIDIVKHAEQPQPVKPELLRQNTPAPTSDNAAKFVSGVEEDLNVAVDMTDDPPLTEDAP